MGKRRKKDTTVHYADGRPGAACMRGEGAKQTTIISHVTCPHCWPVVEQIVKRQGNAKAKREAARTPAVGG